MDARPRDRAALRTPEGARHLPAPQAPPHLSRHLSGAAPRPHLLRRRTRTAEGRTDPHASVTDRLGSPAAGGGAAGAVLAIRFDSIIESAARLPRTTRPLTARRSPPTAHRPLTA